MCMVSKVSGYGQQTWPRPNLPATFPGQFPGGLAPPSHLPVPVPYSVPGVETEDEKRMKIWWEHFKKALAAAKEFDDATGQPDCVDPEKEKWMAEVLKRIEALEARTAGAT